MSRIRVRVKATGQVGTIPEGEFNESIYEKETALPQLPYEVGGGILGSLIGGPIGSGVGAATGRQVGRISERGLPTSREEYKQMYGTDLEQLLDLAKTAGLWTSTSYLAPKILRPGKTLATMRAGRAARTGATIPGEKIAEAGMKYAENAPASYRPAAQKYALQAIEKYGGKNLSVLKALAEKRASQKAAFLASRPEVGKGARAGFEAAVGKALQQEIKGVSPAVSQIDKALSLLMRGKQTAGYWARRIAPWLILRGGM